MGPEKNFQSRGLRRPENAILRLLFASTVFHKRVILVIIYAEYTESLLGIRSHLESTLDPPWLGTEKSFRNESSQRAGNAILRLVVAFSQRL